MTESSADEDCLSCLLVVCFALCRSVHSGMLDGFQLDISHSWTALLIPLPATAVLGNGTFLVICSLIIADMECVLQNFYLSTTVGMDFLSCVACMPGRLCFACINFFLFHS